jgi:serine/threonine protein kinase
MAPQKFGKFTLIKKLATGGMAEVFLARQPLGTDDDGRHVVLKRILPHYSDDPGFVKMFQNEARVASKFSHPNIAQIFEYGHEGGRWYIAMEFVHGEDLGQLMRQSWATGQWLARPLALGIVARAAEGLHYAHTRKDDEGRALEIVHRDISPQNILVSFDGTVKVVDFGIAKAAGGESNDSSSGIKGKFAYLAPEQAHSQPMDGRTDVFALGLVLYELLTGVRPFKRDNELATLQAAMECAIPPPSQAAEIDVDLDELVMKALARAPADRYPDARAFQVALEETLARDRLVASSVQIAELMATLFADRLAAESKLGAPAPTAVEERTDVVAPPKRPPPRRTTTSTMPEAPPRPAVPYKPSDRSWAKTPAPLVPVAPAVEKPGVPPKEGWSALWLIAALVVLAGSAAGYMSLREPAGGHPILLSVDTTPVTVVKVSPADPSRAPFSMGQTPFVNGKGVMLEDTVVLEYPDQCLSFVWRFPFTAPNAPKDINKEFGIGKLKLATTPAALKGLTVVCNGKSLGSASQALSLYEGVHHLELRGDGLTLPVPFEVTITPGKTETKRVDLSDWTAR